MDERRNTDGESERELAELRKRVADLEAAQAEHDRAEALLRANEERYRLLVDHLELSLCSYDADGRVLFMNPAGARYFGLSPREIEGRPLHDLFPDMGDEMVRRARDVFTSGTVLHFEEELSFPVGKRWFSSTLQPVRDSENRIVAVQTISYDITERKLAEQRIEHLNWVLRAIRNVNQLITVEKDRGQLIQGVCDRLSETPGYSSAWVVLLTESGDIRYVAEAGGDSRGALSDLVSRNEVPGCAGEALKTTGVVTIEAGSAVCGDCPAATAHDTTTAAYCVRLEHAGKVYGIMGVDLPTEAASDPEEQSLFAEVAADVAIALHAISEEDDRRRMEEALRESRRHLAKAQEIAHIGSWEWDVLADKVDRSKGVLKLYGIPEDVPASEKILRDSVHPEDRDRFDKAIADAVAGEAPGVIDYRIVRPDGEVRFLHVEAEVHRDESGRVVKVVGIAQDVTERKRAEEAIRESEEKFRSLAEQSLMAIVVVQDGVIKYYNDLLPEMSGYTREDIECWGPHEHETKLLHPGDYESVMEQAAAQQSDGADNLKLYSVRGVRKDGEVRWVDVYVKDILYGGQPAVLDAIVDVTDRKQAEEALAASESKFRGILSSMVDLVFVFDREGRFTFCHSPSPGELILAPEDFIGKRPADVVPPHVNELFMKAWDENRNGSLAEFEYWVEAGGEIRWFSAKMSPVFTRAEYDGSVAVVRDVTDHKRAEEALRESEHKLRTIFENANDAIVYVDDTGTVLDVNDRLGEIFGWDTRDVIGRNFADFDFVDSKTMQTLVERFAETISSGAPDLAAFEVQRRDGSPIEIEASTRTIFGDGGSRRVLAIIRDITERKRAEEEAARARALEELDHLRTALLASVSHELRTPLTSIKGLASSLLQPDVHWDQQTQREFLTAIDQASDRLTHIVDDLMDMSQLEAGIMRMERTRSTISAIVKQLGDQLREITRTHIFETHVPPNLPVVYVDEVRVGEVITNLVSNAAAYSDEGSRIVLAAERRDDEIVVTVSDEGIGIPKEHLEKVFDRFYRLESGAMRRRGGSGLGLAICKGIIEAHGGRIWAESQLGKGSTFGFSLPISDTADV